MDLLNKLTIKSLKLNKKRTIVTIIGIMLSVALITAVATMYSSAIKSLINFETYRNGNFHIAFYDVNVNDIYKIEKNKGVEKLYLTNNIGYAKLNNSKNEYKPYAYIKAFTNDALENLEDTKIKLKYYFGNDPKYEEYLKRIELLEKGLQSKKITLDQMEEKLEKSKIKVLNRN